jgi:hypothetical protein
MQRKASAVWQGDLKTGKGAISTDSSSRLSIPSARVSRTASAPIPKSCWRRHTPDVSRWRSPRNLAAQA